MLGKGLESLIPQKGNQGQGSNSDQYSSANQNATPRFVQQPVQPSLQQSQPQFQAQPQMQSLPQWQPQRPSVQPQVQTQPQVSQSQPRPTVQSLPQQPQQQQPSSSQLQPSHPHSQKKDELAQESIYHIELDKITPNPDQPRRHFDQDALHELANSIREFGFLQPLVVSQVKKESANGVDVEYQIIAGERRFMAAKMLGLPRVPAIVRNVSLEREKLELGVIENIQREDLNPIEMARSFQRLQEEFRMTQREIAAKLGKSREFVANSVRLLDLPEAVQGALEKGEVSESSARMLLAIEDPGAQQQLLREIIELKLTTRDVRERIQRLAFLGGTANGAAMMAGAAQDLGLSVGGVPTAASAIAAPRRGRPPLQEVQLQPEVRMLRDELSNELGAPIEIKKTAHNGSISITFFSEEELENILRKLGGNKD
jgi:ParB family chromosome partitioning protein